MKGQVFTVAKLHYVNGIVYEVARRGTTNFQDLASLSVQTTKSGKVKHPLIRVRTLARLAEGIGLIEIRNKNEIKITALGKQYTNACAAEKWIISKDQQILLRKHIIADYYRTETIYAITTLFELCKKGYKGDELAHRFAIDIGKDIAWKSEVTYRGFTRFGLDYIAELGLFDIDEKDLLLENFTKEQRYQDDSNSVEPILIPAGKIPRPKPKKYGAAEKYSTNPRRARVALEKAKFKCELDSNHSTFINKKSKKQYMEAHHLIPMSKQGAFEYDIDVPENILCLCPTCHRKMHLAQDNEKKVMLSEAFTNRKEVLQKRGIEINLEILLSAYAL